MDKWLKDILPDKDPYHNRGRDQMRKNGGSGIRVPVVVHEILQITIRQESIFILDYVVNTEVHSL